MQPSPEILMFPTDTRRRIIAAAAGLIAAGGADAATTRAVASAAAVQAPTIYRLFGDKTGLLDAVAEDTLARYVSDKALEGSGSDPVADLRAGWDTHVAFGLAHPAIYALISTNVSGHASPAGIAGMAVLRERVRRVARIGRLMVSEERAVDLIHAAGTGTVLTLLTKAPHERGGLADAAREAVLSAVLGDRSAADLGPAVAASTLRAHLDDVVGLTAGERALLDELLIRIAQAG